MYILQRLNSFFKKRRKLKPSEEEEEEKWQDHIRICLREH